MIRLTRRQALAAPAAAMAAAAAPEELYPPDLVRRHDEAVDRLLRTQVTDAANPHRGGYPDEFGLYHAGSGAGVLESCMAAYLCPQSRHQGNNELVRRMRLAAAFLERVQLPDGNVNLLTTNFNSPPDTGFATHVVASAARLAQLQKHAELQAIAERWLRRAGAAMAVGGVHTPNHRWVICEALAAIDEVFPDPRYRRRIDQWLAEGIDIDGDGQFTERSTSIYNTVVDKALTVVAIKQQRWELLDAVRRNLDAMQYLLHANGEVVTEISRRQDLNARGDISRYWLPLRYLAVRDGNARYAAMARMAEARAGSLAAMMQYPELRAALPAPGTLPDNFEKYFESLGVVRWRRGPVSATLPLGEVSRFFALRKGEAVVQAVRFASAFFGKGQFAAGRWTKTAAGYRLEQNLEGVYYQPFDPPRRITTANYDSTRAQRKHSEVCRLTQAVEVRERKGGFSLAIESLGTDGVPVAIEISLRPGGKLDGCTSGLITSERASYQVGSDEVRFGPGVVPSPHQWTQIRGAEPQVPGTSVYVTGFTPFRHTVEFEV
jgi:hypothetical protein